MTKLRWSDPPKETDPARTQPSGHALAKDDGSEGKSQLESAIIEFKRLNKSLSKLERQIADLSVQLQTIEQRTPDWKRASSQLARKRQSLLLGERRYHQLNDFLRAKQ